MRLSCITVCYNNLDGLRKTTESVLAQAVSGFEWIVIDGSSTDGSVDELKAVANRSRGVREINFRWVSESDHGIYDAMNKGLRMARGEYVIFLNSGDCFCDNDVLRRLMDSPREADVIYGDINLVRGGGLVAHEYPSRIDLKELFLIGLPHGGAIIRAEALRRYGGYDDGLRIVSDWKFWLQLCRDGGTFEHRPVVVSNFDMAGISERRKFQIRIERFRVWLSVFGTRGLIPYAKYCGIWFWRKVNIIMR